MKKRLFSALFSLVLLAALLPAAALANEPVSETPQIYDLSKGSIAVSVDDKGNLGKLTITDADNDGSITAIGGEKGAGIGGGANADGTEVEPGTSKLTPNGKIEYYESDVEISKANPIKTITGTYTAIIAGANQSVAKGSRVSLVFQSNLDLNDFQCVILDEESTAPKELEKGTDYTITSEKSDDTEITVVTLNPDFVAALSSGKHTLSIVSDYGTSAAAFRMVRESSGGGSASESVVSYAVSVDDAKNGSVSVSAKNASKGTTITITAAPGKGYTLETLNVLDKSGNKIQLDAVTIGEKYTFTMPSGDVTVTATFMEDNSMLNYFIDVNAKDYFYDSVLWAAKNGIASGTDDSHFSPYDYCTRAQIVTFLWRAAGSPEPKSLNSFSDVAADSYYANAVAWAVENGITNGTGGGKFSPDATCTKAHAVTFLYRAAGTETTGSNSFPDVADDAYYNDAVTWAEQNEIETGVCGLFCPDNDCTRAKFVTYLWKAVAE